MAAGAALGRFHFPVIYERLRLFHTGFALVDEAFRIEVEDVFRITQSGFGIAVTFQTESQSGVLWIQTHGTALPVAALSRIGARSGLVVLIWLWQFMHVCDVGTFEWADLSTFEWQ